MIAVLVASILATAWFAEQFVVQGIVALGVYSTARKAKAAGETADRNRRRLEEQEYTNLMGRENIRRGEEQVDQHATHRACLVEHKVNPNWHDWERLCPDAADERVVHDACLLERKVNPNWTAWKTVCPDATDERVVHEVCLREQETNAQWGTWEGLCSDKTALP